MKKVQTKSKKNTNDEMRTEYDFSKGIRNKYASRLVEQQHLIRLDPDAAKVFKTSEEVNTALHAIITALPKSQRRKALSA